MIILVIESLFSYLFSPSFCFLYDTSGIFGNICSDTGQDSASAAFIALSLRLKFNAIYFTSKTTDWLEYNTPVDTYLMAQDAVVCLIFVPMHQNINVAGNLFEFSIFLSVHAVACYFFLFVCLLCSSTCGFWFIQSSESFFYSTKLTQITAACQKSDGWGGHCGHYD